ncbi:hypothetical protein FWC31_01065 [Candidatus Saccharibacteria bacterium]|nr:hypothetical protein [Candidatus Saccharibacteria bacterium]
MYENREITLKNPLLSIKGLLAGLLGFGVILASTHGVLMPDHQRDLSPTDFKAKVLRESHTHNDDSHVHYDHIFVDPKHLRSTRSEGDKLAESDRLRGNWDVYQV